MEWLDCDRMFIAVMEMGSFAKAAQRLGTSSGQASKLISRLEQTLGVQLFKRSTRALAPTEVGRAYYERIRQLLDEFDALDEAVRNAVGQPSGRIRLSVPVTFGTGPLSPLLIAFAQRYPQIELDVSFTDRRANIVDEEFDLALRIGQLPDSSLMARKLCDIRILTLAAPDYLAQHGPPSHWQQLHDHPCILDTNFTDPYHWRFRQGPDDIQSLPVRGRLKFSNAGVCLQAACAGLGIACLPAFVAGDALRQGRLVPVLQEFELPPLCLFALYPPARHLAQRCRCLIDYLVDAFATGPQWEQGW